MDNTKENTESAMQEREPEDFREILKKMRIALRKEKERQDAIKALMGEAYVDYGLVLAHDDGRPYEERQIMDKLRALEKEFDLTPAVFHSLRHCSTSVKLQLSGGDIKAVQGDTGHAQARMVTDLYAHIDHEDRRQLALKLEDQFFRRGSPAEAAPADDTEAAVRLLKENPDMAKLIVGILSAKTRMT